MPPNHQSLKKKQCTRTEWLLGGGLFEILWCLKSSFIKDQCDCVSYGYRKYSSRADKWVWLGEHKESLILNSPLVWGPSGERSVKPWKYCRRVWLIFFDHGSMLLLCASWIRGSPCYLPHRSESEHVISLILFLYRKPPLYFLLQLDWKAFTNSMTFVSLCISYLVLRTTFRVVWCFIFSFVSL